ncbi:hypothetical protein GCM10028815_23880 [Mariniluteicoccus flavus]
MERPLGYFWSARHSQIYPELGEMEAAGLVGHREVAGPGPRPTKRYHVTEAGRTAMRVWLEEPLRPGAARNELLLRVYSLWLADPDHARRFLAEQRAECVEQMAVYELEAENLPEPAMDTPEFWNWATLQNGLMQVRAKLAWFDLLLDRLA